MLGNRFVPALDKLTTKTLSGIMVEGTFEKKESGGGELRLELKKFSHNVVPGHFLREKNSVWVPPLSLIGQLNKKWRRQGVCQRQDPLLFTK